MHTRLYGVWFVFPNGISKKMPNGSGVRQISLFHFGVSFIVLNYISLGFMQIHTDFYFNYIIYSGLLIFCCQNVATFLLYQSFQN